MRVVDGVLHEPDSFQQRIEGSSMVRPSLCSTPDLIISQDDSEANSAEPAASSTAEVTSSAPPPLYQGSPLEPLSRSQKKDIRDAMNVRPTVTIPCYCTQAEELFVKS